MERRLFQATVLVASIVPIAAGAAGILEGPAIVPGVGSASSDLESHFRYLSGLLLGIGLAFVVCVADLERRVALYHALSLIVILGGFGRLLGAIETGVPTGGNLLALVMELVIVPLLLVWVRRIDSRRDAGAEV